MLFIKMQLSLKWLKWAGLPAAVLGVVWALHLGWPLEADSPLNP